MELVGWLRSRGERRKRETRCKCCGECCRLFGTHLHASKSDLERWRRLGREDLLSRVNRLGWIWTEPASGRRIERCPFLQPNGDQTFLCSIHDIKPDICRSYPTLAHGRRCLRGGFFSLLWGLLWWAEEMAWELSAIAVL